MWPGFFAQHPLNVMSQRVSFHSESSFSQLSLVRSFKWSPAYNAIFQTEPEGSHALESAHCCMMMGELKQQRRIIKVANGGMEDGQILPSTDSRVCFPFHLINLAYRESTGTFWCCEFSPQHTRTFNSTSFIYKIHFKIYCTK